MLKPTSEEVEEVLSEWKPVVAHFCQKLTKGDRHIFVDGVSIWSRESADETIKITPKMVLSLAVLRVALLAQEEELKLLRESNERKSGLVADLTSALSNRNADNQELKRKGEQLCCRVGVLEMENQALKASMEAEYIEQQAKHIQTLVGENEELKAKLEGTFKFDKPKRGEALRYVTDDETGVVRVKWETNHD